MRNIPSLSIIIVEDEPLVLLAASHELQDADFDVIEAGTADEALKILETDAATIHAIFTDVHMPGAMDGIQLAHHVRRHWPHIGLLVASGLSRPHYGDLRLDCRFVAKPYNLGEVVGHIRELAGG
jgi:CheY-like chemotaxis protein